MSLRLLGPPELIVDEKSVKIGGPRERVLLAALVLRANRVISVEQLVDAVWDDDPPLSARSQVQVCISGLRKLFREVGQVGTIRTSPPGYVLEIPYEELDSAEFARLVVVARTKADEGRLVDAAGILRRALALWRGPAFDGVRSHFVQRGAALLENSRLAAVEERVRLDLELGRHEEISGELRALVEQHPLSERLYRFLMLALYRAGRQVEALEVGRQARATLIDEVGVEPGQELRDLEAAILNRDTALDLHTAPVALAPKAEESELVELVIPRLLPGSTADFIGRESQIAEVKQLLSDEHSAATAPYGMRIVALSGRGGVGKSTLALRVAHELGDVFSDGHLYADLHGRGDDDDSMTHVLGRFLRALGISSRAMPEDMVERAEMYRSMLADKRLLIVLDDVTSEEQILPLLPGSPSCPVITTSRTRLTGLAGAHWIHVDVFDLDKSIEFLSKIVSPERIQDERIDAVDLVNLCGRLPLALRIAGARLASRPHWRISDLVRRLADEPNRLNEFAHRGLELRSSIGLTYRTLPNQAKRLFRLFALTRAPDFPAWTAAALLDTDLFAAEDLIASLVEAQLLDTVEYPGERLRYRFHELIQIYALEQLTETEAEAEAERALARVLGGWLAFAEHAHRKEYGGDHVIVHGTAPRWHLPDGVDAELIGRPIEWWDGERRALVAAIRRAAAAGMDELCWDLALTSMTLFEIKGYFDDWQETAQLAYDTAEQAGNRVGQAAMLYSLGTLHMLQKRLREAEWCFMSALEIFEAEGVTGGCALVLRDAAFIDRVRGNFAAMLVKYDEALAKMRAVDDPVGEATILRSLAKYLIDEGDVDQAQPLLDDALALCKRASYRRGEAQVMNRFAELYRRSGQIELARQALHRVLRISRDIGDRIGEVHGLYGMGLVRRLEGRLDNAETTLAHALVLAKGIGERLIEGQARYALGEIELVRDNTSAAVEHLTEAAKLFLELSSALWQAKTLILLSDIRRGEGDVAAAGEELERAAGILAELDSKEAAALLDQVTKFRATVNVAETSAFPDEG